MSIRPISSNIISEFLHSNIFCLTPERNDENNFVFVLPIVIDPRKTDRVAKVQIICQNQLIFKSQFPNKYYSQTSDFKKYNKTGTSNEILNKEYLKNIFSNYNKNSKPNEGFTKNYEFSLNSDQNLHNLYSNSFNDSSDFIYLLNLGKSFSNLIEDVNINKTRILLLDENDVILQSLDFFDTNYKEIKRRKSIVNKTAFYQELTRNLTNNVRITMTDRGEVLVNLEDNIDTDNFKNMSLELIYINRLTSISIKNAEPKKDILIQQNCEEFLEKIAKDCLLGLESFKFQVNIFLNTTEDTIILNSVINSNRQSDFIKRVFIFKKNTVINQIFNDLNASINSEFARNKINVRVDKDEDNEKVLNIIKVNDIKRNGTSINFYYKNEEFTLENRKFYKGLSLKSLLDNNSSRQLSFWLRKISRSTSFSIDLEIDNVKRSIRSSSPLVFKETFSSLIDLTNIIFKRNLVVNDFNFNIGLSDNNSSIFTLNNITLNNIQNFNDVAMSFGYIDSNNQGDVEKFLKNCIIKVENSTSLNNINIRNYKNSYFFFKNFFENFTESDSVINVSNSNFKFIHTNDNYHLRSNKPNPSFEKRKIIDFFTTLDIPNAYKKIINREIDLKSDLKIKILPIPFIIIDNLKNDQNLSTGIDSLGNPNVDNADIKNKLCLELVNYFYSGNTNLNYSKYNEFITTLFSQDEPGEVIPPTKYSEFFNYLFDTNVKRSSMYNKTVRYNTSQILSEINVNEELSKFKIRTGTFEENLFEKYFNFAESNLEFFYSDNPFNLNFEDINYFFNNEKISFQKIKVSNLLSKKFKIDISSLKTFYTDQKIKDIVPKIRLTLHFLLKNENENIEIDDIDTTNFTITNIDGVNCLTYNEVYMTGTKYNKFSDFNTGINNEFINIVQEGDNIFVEIDSEENQLNINNLDYETYRDFFTFAKNNNIDLLEKVVLRTSLSFEIRNTEEEIEYITSVFSQEISRNNLIDQDRITISSLDNISSVIIRDEQNQ